MTTREVSFAHDGVRHRIQYRDGDFIDQLGAHDLTFSYTIPLRQGIAKGPYRNLFTERLPILFRDCLNREVGELFDPVYGGPFKCKPQTYRDVADVQKLDGVDVSVEFVRTLETGDSDELPTAPSISGVTTGARALQVELGPLQEFEQIVADQQMTDVLSALSGAGAQLDRQGQKVAAALGDLANKMDKVDKQIEKSENPQLWGVQNSARRVRESAFSLKAKGDNPAERIVTVTTNADKTLGAVADEVKLTLAEFIRLNPALAAAPMVAAGTLIRRRVPV